MKLLLFVWVFVQLLVQSALAGLNFEKSIDDILALLPGAKYQIASVSIVHLRNSVAKTSSIPKDFSSIRKASDAEAPDLVSELQRARAFLAANDLVNGVHSLDRAQMLAAALYYKLPAQDRLALQEAAVEGETTGAWGPRGATRDAS